MNSVNRSVVALLVLACAVCMAPGAMGGDVIYRADQVTENVFELYRFDIKSGLAVKLSGVIAPGGDVLEMLPIGK